MEFRISQVTFSKALQKIQGIVERRQTMPILANVLIEVEDEQIAITATDLEVGVRSIYSAMVDSPGRITVSAKKLFEIVKELPQDDIRVSLKDNERVELRCGKSKFSIMGVSANEYPYFPKVSNVAMSSIDSQILARMIELTSFAICTDETKYNLSGIFLSVDSGETDLLRMVATDGHRLSVVDQPVSTSFPEEFRAGVIIPRKGVSELKRLCDESIGDVLVGYMDNSIVIKKDETTIVIRLVNGTFPEYRRVIPQNNDRHVRISRELLLHALRRMMIMSNEKIKGVRFDLATDRLTVTSSNPDFGEAVEDMDVMYQGEDMVVRLNARYVVDAISVMESDMVDLLLKDEHVPVIMKETGNDRFMTVVMPMRI